MKRKEIILAVLIIISFTYFIKEFFSSTDFQKNACDLKKLAIRGKITRVIEGRYGLFDIDSLQEDYSLRESIFNKSECNICTYRNQQYYLQLGDSIMKEANSDIIYFKRGDTSFVVKLDASSCK
jgi:hypothetical protein